MIIAADNPARRLTQEDIVIYDKSLVPPVLASPARGSEGVYLYNSVLARVEVKSAVTREDIRTFVESALDICALKHSVQPGCKSTFTAPVNLLFAFDSDATVSKDVDQQLRRLTDVMQERGCDPLSGSVSMLCIPRFGFWKLGESDHQRQWQRLSLNTPENNIAWFVGCVSNFCFQEHARKQGRDPTLGLEGGIGMYFPHPFEPVRI
jgi:hypothetical protein